MSYGPVLIFIIFWVIKEAQNVVNNTTSWANICGESLWEKIVPILISISRFHCYNNKHYPKKMSCQTYLLKSLVVIRLLRVRSNLQKFPRIFHNKMEWKHKQLHTEEYPIEYSAHEQQLI